MKEVTNRFGTGTFYEIEDVPGKIYARCTACMSVYTDLLSWAQQNPDRMTTNIAEADSVIVLGCQVTDLAILNDLRHAESIDHENIFMSGCLAQRFDIDIPYKRLDVVRIENEPINDFSLVEWAKPFWEKDFEDGDDNLKPGNLFRNYYPLKIGAGCKLSCKYCTIRDTRGDYYEANAYDQVGEFLSHENVVLISDNPTDRQVLDWCSIATKYNKPISFRNMEPSTVTRCWNELFALSQAGLLDILHCPIQSESLWLVRQMNRNSIATGAFLKVAFILRTFGTKLATNVIIDYTIDGTLYPNCNKDYLDREFDYWVWNPYFDGNWDREKAEARWEKYLT